MGAQKNLGRRLSLVIASISEWNGRGKDDVGRDFAEVLGYSKSTLDRWYRGELPQGIKPQIILSLLEYSRRKLPADLAYGLFRHLFQAYARYHHLDVFPDEDALLQRYYPEMFQSRRFPLPAGDSSLQLGEEISHIERDYDRHLIGFLTSGVGIVTVVGSHQSGKTALMANAMTAMSALGYQCVSLDFGLLAGVAEDGDLFYREFCSMFSEALDLSDETGAIWEEGLMNNRASTKYITKFILPFISQPFVLFMDDVDILAHAPFRDDFFGMLRSWFEKRKLGGPWRKVNIVLGISTEPFLLIEDPLQSPFNVGRPINLEQDFTYSEAELFNKLRNNCFTAEKLNELMSLVNGHPYLISLSLTVVANSMYTVPELFARALDENGPFGEHLRYMKRKLENSGLKETLLAAWQGENIDEETKYRLKRSGYSRLAEDGSLVPRCRLYQDYLTA